MEPVLGWAALSRAALNRAENEMAGDAEGMRDEVGVLTLHTGYANRFFPGTSVQQTRLRYALFVPWLVQGLLASSPRSGSPRKALAEAELALIRQLPPDRGAGTIGRDRAKAGKLVSIPPSESYWVALTRWGILAQEPMLFAAATRSDMFERWKQWPAPREPGSGLRDEDKQLLTTTRPLFHRDLPDPPKELLKGKALTFAVEGRERGFLRNRLMETRRDDGQPSFLSRLVFESIVPSAAQQPWSKAMLDVADAADRAALLRARDSAAVAAVVRAAYNAAVETLRDRDEKGAMKCTKHREHLVSTVEEFGQRATALDLGAISTDGIAMGGLRPVLGHVQGWLRSTPDAKVSPSLIRVLADWEYQRKDKRARLPQSGAGLDARREWRAEETRVSEAIAYRWPLIRQLLTDASG